MGTVEAVYAAAQSGKGCIAAITFDDGLRSQFEIARPLLCRYGIRATFFPIPSVFGGYIPSAHALQQILSIQSGKECAVAFNRFVETRFPNHRSLLVPFDRRIRAGRVHEDTVTANLKDTLIASPFDMQRAFVAYALGEIGQDQTTLAQRIFMSAREITLLAHEGHHIGGHTQMHRTVDAMSPAELAEDIEESFSILRGIIGTAPRLFSYPHGRSNPAAIAHLRARGITHAVTIEHREVVTGDSAFQIPRFDATDLTAYLNAHRH